MILSSQKVDCLLNWLNMCLELNNESPVSDIAKLRDGTVFLKITNIIDPEFKHNTSKTSCSKSKLNILHGFLKVKLQSENIHINFDKVGDGIHVEICAVLLLLVVCALICENNEKFVNQLCMNENHPEMENLIYLMVRNILQNNVPHINQNFQSILYEDLDISLEKTFKSYDTICDSPIHKFSNTTDESKMIQLYYSKIVTLSTKLMSCEDSIQDLNSDLNEKNMELKNYKIIISEYEKKNKKLSKNNIFYDQSMIELESKINEFKKIADKYENLLEKYNLQNQELTNINKQNLELRQLNFEKEEFYARHKRLFKLLEEGRQKFSKLSAEKEKMKQDYNLRISDIEGKNKTLENDYHELKENYEFLQSQSESVKSGDVSRLNSTLPLNYELELISLKDKENDLMEKMKLLQDVILEKNDVIEEKSNEIIHINTKNCRYVENISNLKKLLAQNVENERKNSFHISKILKKENLKYQYIVDNFTKIDSLDTISTSLNVKINDISEKLKTFKIQTKHCKYNFDTLKIRYDHIVENVKKTFNVVFEKLKDIEGKSINLNIFDTLNSSINDCSNIVKYGVNFNSIIKTMSDEYTENVENHNETIRNLTESHCNERLLWEKKFKVIPKVFEILSNNFIAFIDKMSILDNIDKMTDKLQVLIIKSIILCIILQQKNDEIIDINILQKKLNCSLKTTEDLKLMMKTMSDDYAEKLEDHNETLNNLAESHSNERLFWEKKFNVVPKVFETLSNNFVNSFNKMSILDNIDKMADRLQVLIIKSVILCIIIQQKNDEIIDVNILNEKLNCSLKTTEDLKLMMKIMSDDYAEKLEDHNETLNNLAESHSNEILLWKKKFNVIPKVFETLSKNFVSSFNKMSILDYINKMADRLQVLIIKSVILCMIIQKKNDEIIDVNILKDKLNCSLKTTEYLKSMMKAMTDAYAEKLEDHNETVHHLAESHSEKTLCWKKKFNIIVETLSDKVITNLKEKEIFDWTDKMTNKLQVLISKASILNDCLKEKENKILDTRQLLYEALNQIKILKQCKSKSKHFLNENIIALLDSIMLVLNDKKSEFNNYFLIINNKLILIQNGLDKIQKKVQNYDILKNELISSKDEISLINLKSCQQSDDIRNCETKMKEILYDFNNYKLNICSKLKKLISIVPNDSNYNLKDHSESDFDENFDNLYLNLKQQLSHIFDCDQNSTLTATNISKEQTVDSQENNVFDFVGLNPQVYNIPYQKINETKFYLGEIFNPVQPMTFFNGDNLPIPCKDLDLNESGQDTTYFVGNSINTNMKSNEDIYLDAINTKINNINFTPSPISTSQDNISLKRIDQLQKRNKICPNHLKSNYPLELMTAPPSQNIKLTGTPILESKKGAIEQDSLNVDYQQKKKKKNSLKKLFKAKKRF
ncbi:hypothetical protein A3Q56_02487 [Intoshia linei]|uniref:Uncharacterized protein n=1 Tax=Intoshia linei TaxID=1819745 RepID=A0A177B636_9BILA|nr:hypothetical protein A3Q56_02487 [Intoshia linei]